MKATVTKRDFKAWLESKKPTAIVGDRADMETCPLARYFLNINGLKAGRVDVRGDYVQIWDADIVHYGWQAKTTPWMEDFITKVDESSCNKITAKKALEILLNKEKD